MPRKPLPPGLDKLSNEELAALSKRFPAGYIDELMGNPNTLPSDTELPDTAGDPQVLRGKHLVVVKNGKLEFSMLQSEYEDQVLRPLYSFNAQKISRQLSNDQAKAEMLEYVAFNILAQFAPNDVKSEINTLFGTNFQ